MAQKVITSEAYQLIKEDLKKWLKNFVVFSGPAILAGLLAFQQGWDAKVGLTAFGIALYGAIIDLFKKFVSETRYK